MPERPPELYGIPISMLSRVCQVSLKTATRWKKGQTVPPKTALMVIRGDLGMFDPEWAAWCIRGDSLVSPEGWTITVNDVRAAPLLRAQVAAYQTENRLLRGLDGEQLEEQPLPEQWLDLKQIG